MNICLVLLILLFLVLNKRQISGYTNYIDYKTPFLNCSTIHEINYSKIKNMRMQGLCLKEE